MKPAMNRKAEAVLGRHRLNPAEVEVGASGASHLPYGGGEADLNIHLEWIMRGAIPLARRNFFMVNQEINHFTGDYASMDAILVKTAHARDVVRAYLAKRGLYAPCEGEAPVRGRGPGAEGRTSRRGECGDAGGVRVVHTKHSSRDIRALASSLGDGRDGDDRRRFDVAIHAAGKSPYKNTPAVVKAWRRHPEWPTLHIVARRRALGLVDAAGPHPPNVRMHIGRLSQDEMTRLMATAGLHVCPSGAEGWGHYINEARSAGAVIMVTNGQPMNELLNGDDDSIFVQPASSRRVMEFAPADMYRLPGVAWYEVNAHGIEEAMERFLSMGDSEARAMGDAARRRYEEDDAFARRRLVSEFSNVLGGDDDDDGTRWCRARRNEPHGRQRERGGAGYAGFRRRRWQR